MRTKVALGVFLALMRLLCESFLLDKILVIKVGRPDFSLLRPAGFRKEHPV